VVVIDVNPSNTKRCPAFVEKNYMENHSFLSPNHPCWIFLIEPIPMVCGMPQEPSWFGSYTSLKMKPPTCGQKPQRIVMWQLFFGQDKCLSNEIFSKILLKAKGYFWRVFEIDFKNQNLEEGFGTKSNLISNTNNLSCTEQGNAYEM